MFRSHSKGDLARLKEKLTIELEIVILEKSD